MCRWCAREQVAGGRAVVATGAGGVAGGRGPAGQQPGGHGVVDPLAGHRVDQPGRVAGQQHAPAPRGGGPAARPARQRQVVGGPVGAAVGRAGEQPLQLGEQEGARGRLLGGAGVDQLAVADVGEPVAAVEGPGVRRLAAVAVRDHLEAGPPGGGRGVAADRQRAAAGSVTRPRAAPPSGVRRRRPGSAPGRCRPRPRRHRPRGPPRAPGGGAAPRRRRPRARPGGRRTPGAGSPGWGAPSVAGRRRCRG